ncbi:MAG: hypothetical protein IKO61_08135 [Lachnospiraceae bacterium]|nr:hypothetical protein [Lachnospiraceae bacterium]
MAMPTVGSFLWDIFIGVAFVVGAMIALPRKKTSVPQVLAVMLECAIMLCVLDVAQKQDPNSLPVYLFWFCLAGVLEMIAIIQGTKYTEGSVYKRTVVNAFIIIFVSAIVFAVCAFIEPAKDVMAAETTSRSSGGIGYLYICVVQLIATVISALLVKLLLKWIKGDGVVYRVLFCIIMMYDILGVPARGYINYKSRHEAPARDDVLIVLGITYMVMVLTIVVVIFVVVNVVKGREKHKFGSIISEKSLFEKKIIGEIDREDREASDGIDRAIEVLSKELEKRNMVLELISDMDAAKKMLGDKAAKLRKELETLSSSFASLKGSGGYMTICVRPLGDEMMLMSEISFNEGYEGEKTMTITRVL